MKLWAKGSSSTTDNLPRRRIVFTSPAPSVTVCLSGVRQPTRVKTVVQLSVYGSLYKAENKFHLGDAAPETRHYKTPDGSRVGWREVLDKFPGARQQAPII